MTDLHVQLLQGVLALTTRSTPVGFYGLTGLYGHKVLHAKSQKTRHKAYKMIHFADHGVAVPFCNKCEIRFARSDEQSIENSLHGFVVQLFGHFILAIRYDPVQNIKSEKVSCMLQRGVNKRTIASRNTHK